MRWKIQEMGMRKSSPIAGVAARMRKGVKRSTRSGMKPVARKSCPGAEYFAPNDQETLAICKAKLVLIL
jgi:hypothetical protein